MSFVPWVAKEAHALRDCAEFSAEFPPDDYGGIVQTTWRWDEKSLRWEELCMEFSVPYTNTVFLGQDNKSHSPAVQGQIKHVEFLFFSMQALRQRPVKHLTGIDFCKMQVKLTFFLYSLQLFLVTSMKEIVRNHAMSRCEKWKALTLDSGRVSLGLVRSLDCAGRSGAGTRSGGDVRVRRNLKLQCHLRGDPVVAKRNTCWRFITWSLPRACEAGDLIWSHLTLAML